MKLINRLLIGTIIFILPSNLFLILDHHAGYISGIKIDYLLPKIYLSSILILFFLLINYRQVYTTLKKIFQTKKQFFIFTVLSLILLILQFSHINTLNSLLHIFNISLGIIFFATIATTLKIISSKKNLSNQQNAKTKKKSMISIQEIIIWCFFTIVFQVSLATYQFTQQKSLIGYYLLGEANIAQRFNMSKTTLTLDGSERTLGYGTSAHPNLLAGLIAIYTIFILKHSQQKIFLKITVFLFFLLGMYLTQSLSATTGFMLFWLTDLLTKKWSQKFINKQHQLSIMLAVTIIIFLAISIFISQNNFSHHSFKNRKDLQLASLELTSQNPILGVGVNQFTANLHQTSYNNFRFHQPVHNSILLIISETGLLGLCIILFILISAWKKFSAQEKKRFLHIFILLLPMLSLDHYFFSLIPGFYLLSFAFLLHFTLD